MISGALAPIGVSPYDSRTSVPAGDAQPQSDRGVGQDTASAGILTTSTVPSRALPQTPGATSDAGASEFDLYGDMHDGAAPPTLGGSLSSVPSGSLHAGGAQPPSQVAASFHQAHPLTIGRATSAFWLQHHFQRPSQVPSGGRMQEKLTGCSAVDHLMGTRKRQVSRHARRDTPCFVAEFSCSGLHCCAGCLRAASQAAPLAAPGTAACRFTERPRTLHF